MATLVAVAWWKLDYVIEPRHFCQLEEFIVVNFIASLGKFEQIEHFFPWKLQSKPLRAFNELRFSQKAVLVLNMTEKGSAVERLCVLLVTYLIKCLKEFSCLVRPLQFLDRSINNAGHGKIFVLRVAGFLHEVDVGTK